MENRRCSTIPRILFDIITFLCEVLPIRSVPTFIELLIGAMITQSGFVTQAWLAINPLRTGTSYYKWLQKGKWSWVAVGLQLARGSVGSASPCRFQKDSNMLQSRCCLG
ncbi:hypothetical protein JWG39_02750 [Desulforhopalus vacuolatus]|uniref:hypothetical protein n=1 Tax=Desulforhopalus vacuolatus TaxID=40414 RepID=UPI0019628966|nr:hypothetical protein [Desulforhopalus vacuolatus]MBM9518737.1 hypothetical protein [Desulforhopalus vacuolatus]